MCRIPKPQMDLEIRLYEYYLYKTSEVPQQRMDIAIPSLAYVKHRPGSCGSKFRICSEFDVLHTVPNLAYDTNYGHFLYCAWAWTMGMVLVLHSTLDTRPMYAYNVITVDVVRMRILRTGVYNNNNNNKSKSYPPFNGIYCVTPVVPCPFQFITSACHTSLYISNCIVFDMVL